MRSMGYFGAGFGAVIAKYGGNCEISQVACRAGAVGGGVYLLGQHLTSLSPIDYPTTDSSEPDDDRPQLEGTLSDGTKIKSRFVVGSLDDLPQSRQTSSSQQSETDKTWRSINIVADPLSAVFPQTSDNGPVPAAAIVLVDTGEADLDQNPVYLQIHSEDTGECPHGQCIIYASVRADGVASKNRLDNAVKDFLATIGPAESLLRSTSYLDSAARDDSNHPEAALPELTPPTMIFPTMSHDIAFPDSVLGEVRQVWETVLGVDVAQSTFLRFEEREAEMED